MAQSERDEKKFVKTLFKDFKNNRLELIVDKFVDSQYVNKLVDQMLAENPDFSDNFKKEKVQVERVKAEKNLMRSVKRAYSEIDAISQQSLRKATLESIDITKRKEKPVKLFRAVVNMMVDTTKVSLRFSEISYDQQSGLFYILSDNVRFRIMNEAYYKRKESIQDAKRAAQDEGEIIEDAVEAVEVMEDEIIEVLEEPMEIEADVAPPPPPPPPLVKLEENEEVEVLRYAEQMPEFPGGEAKLFEFISSNISYPELARQANIEGNVFIGFVIDKDGSISNARIKKDIGGGCGREALRVVKSMPKWKPGTQGGKRVRVMYNLPVRFKLK